MSKVKEILRRKREREKKLQASLDSIVGQLRNIGALKIILFGSVAEGNIDVYSDLDLLVIMPSTMSGKEWMKLVYGAVEREIASDIIVYNLKEFKEKLPISSFLQMIVNSGRVVYEKSI